jgi:hypothetical protein
MESQSEHATQIDQSHYFLCMTQNLLNANTNKTFSNKIEVMRTLLRSLRFFTQLVISQLDHFISNRKMQIQTINLLNENKSQAPALIYVHYSSSGVLATNEISALKVVSGLGFNVYVVINTDTPDNSLILTKNSELKEFAILAIVRKNRGYDLGAYRDAYTSVNKQGYLNTPRIFFMNNSVFWIPSKVENYFSSLLNQELDIFGSVISFQYRQHIQTYLFGCITSTGQRKIEYWLLGIKNWHFKRTIVNKGEIKTNLFFSTDTVVKSVPSGEALEAQALTTLHDHYLSSDNTKRPEIIKRLKRNRKFRFAGIPQNPSHANWLELLECGFPGIKIDLIRKNPSGIPDYEIIISELLNCGFSSGEIARLIQEVKLRQLARIRLFLEI